SDSNSDQACPYLVTCFLFLLKFLTRGIIHVIRQNRSPKRIVNPHLSFSRDKALSVRTLLWPVFVFWVVALGMPILFAQSGRIGMTVGTPAVDANGVKYYPVTSVYQGSVQQIVR